MELKPLAFRHLLVLDVLDSPLLAATKEPKIIPGLSYDDCFQAATILSCGTDEALRERLEEPPLALKNWMAERYAEGSLDPAAARQALTDFWEDMWSPPRVKKNQPAPQGMKVVRSSLPWILSEVCALMGLGGLTRNEAWWTKASEGMWETQALKEVVKGNQAMLLSDAAIEEYKELGYTDEQINTL